MTIQARLSPNHAAALSQCRSGLRRTFLCSGRKLYLRTAPFVPFWSDPQMINPKFHAANSQPCLRELLAHALLSQTIKRVVESNCNERKRL